MGEGYRNMAGKTRIFNLLNWFALPFPIKSWTSLGPRRESSVPPIDSTFLHLLIFFDLMPQTIATKRKRMTVCSKTSAEDDNRFYCS